MRIPNDSLYFEKFYFVALCEFARCDSISEFQLDTSILRFAPTKAAYGLAMSL